MVLYAIHTNLQDSSLAYWRTKAWASANTCSLNTLFSCIGYNSVVAWRPCIEKIADVFPQTGHNTFLFRRTSK